MEKIFWRFQLSHPPDHQHAFQGFSQHRPADHAAPAVLIKRLPRVGGYSVIKRVSQ
jgi:hypothetical protein